MKASKADLASILEKLACELRRPDANEENLDIDIDEQYYWFIPGEHLYDPTKEPIGLTLGHLHDEWVWLKEVADGKRELGTMETRWLGSLLRFIADRKLLKL